MTSRRTRRGAATLVLCLSLVAVSALAGCSLLAESVHERAAADGPKKDGASRKAPSVVMFLGDSYTVGDRGVEPESTYAAATARLLGWQVVVGGRSGTGFVVRGRTPYAFLGQFESQLGWRPAPDMLIVSGGHNDWRTPAPQVAAAAHLLLQRARQRWPGTHIVLMGPLWGTGAPVPGAVAVRDALKTLAGQVGVPFVDPIGEQWITGDLVTGQGNAPRLIKKDRTHPTPAGHLYVATRLAADLKRMGLAHPVRKG
ncbi:SGNH/GDSL hydrolase family protein [Actinomadura madurae]|uniref:SGNH/GDSL hydrolase family protein n=1 Tax=Actinomadura madurae TaxID=1993 RepID=UPI002025CC67|nr:SGNH/GDSL hydrolase family protein [Actinomadura madurae]MCP9954218.1 SGNH/GDSL hydrolase family protein [Actinomadura madurae]MCP9970975.1 SGNH/GDSL hydrolase family protein [Actinomadura madurae]MCQ0019693.1 SGNH/GDSL hydrolase family protein [Actinomadura madurae]URM99719.1 SGNH/GDSL hydrolase family protein [Actinomadura madurae]URN10382.1 SGNH/GDSL hydrolase family protein [Actinomadura madurae]